MSGTRFISPKAPATEVARPGLLIVAHGERGGERRDELPARIADLARQSGRFGDVAVGFIRSEPGIEQAAGTGGDRLVVYPLFMSDGYYVSAAIPQRLGLDPTGRDRQGRRVEVLASPGTVAGFAPVVAAHAAGAAAAAGRDPASCHLLLVAHGSSKSPASRRACEAVRDGIVAGAEFRAVHVAFLEEAPFVDDQLSALPGPLVVVGLFVGEGMHGAEDMTAAIAEARRADIIVPDPLPRSALFERLILEALGIVPPARREARSFRP